ncbi:SDR family oxidoreductase [Streptomyces sp. NPDC004111]|uniref:SDR family oxidoreductase n=1 Tax=Streptomyces sp. NPDC004111 TaxID=3364690 RepID=UPI0036A13CF5
MQAILVTGGTGTLGRAVVRCLVEGEGAAVAAEVGAGGAAGVAGAGAGAGAGVEGATGVAEAGADAEGAAVAAEAADAGVEVDGEREIRVLSRRPLPSGVSASRLGSGTSGTSGAPDPSAGRPSGANEPPVGLPGTPYRHLVGDLLNGDGVDAAVRGVRAIVHCASMNGKDDVLATRNLIDAVRRSGGRPHLVYISIVGIDAIPLPYYRAKLAAERLVMESGLPWSILRATQFHDLLATVFAYQRWLPVTLAVKGFRFQPVDVRDVAARLAGLALGEPAGKVPDMGGPQVRDIRDLAATYDRAYGRRRRVVCLRVPGGIARGFASGANLVPDHRVGTTTFDDFVARERERERGNRQGKGKAAGRVRGVRGPGAEK